MQDPDDYFGDDGIVLDENVLAVLDEEERKFNETQRLVQRASRLDNSLPPPAKRQKVFHEPNIGLLRTATFDLEDLPEVSVQGDGLYDLSVFGLAAGSHSDKGDGSVVKEPQKDSANPQQQPLVESFEQPVVNQGPVLPRPVQVQLSRQLPPFHSREVEIPQVSAVRRGHVDSTEDALRRQLDDLRVQIHQLSNAQHEVQKSFQEAEEARLAKEGEVSILRKGIERTAREHAAEVAKIKAAKEAAEAMQVQLQKNMKEEMDRLKTQLTFRQHEMETVTHRSPWSARSKKINRQVPSTPVKLPSQIRQWSLGNDNAGPSFALAETPSQPRLMSTGWDSLDMSRRRDHSVVENAKNTAVLPGFYNSFSSSPPRSSSQVVKGKGKERDNGRLGRGQFQTTSFTGHHLQQPSSPPSSPIRMDRHVESQRDIGSDDAAVFFTSPNETNVHGVQEDADMAEEGKEEPSEDLDIIDPPDWRAELSRLMFTHKFPSFKSLTIHLLINAPLRSSASAEQSQKYAQYNDKILQNLGASLCMSDDLDNLIGAIVDSLIGMAQILNDIRELEGLTALLDLLRVLTLLIPPFPPLLLSSPLGQNNDFFEPSPQIISVLCNIIRNHLTPSNEVMSNEMVALAKATLGLLEALTWNIPMELVPRLSGIPRSPRVLSTLLAPSQPTWLLYRSTRLLALLASHRSLYRELLSFPDPDTDTPEQDPGSRDFGKIPHIEQLAAYLIDTTREGQEADALRETTLAFVASLSIAHQDALTILVQSQTLIPSIVVYLSNLTTPIWEEDELFMESPALIEAVVPKVVRSMLLLYNLVIGANNTTFDLRKKLLLAPHRPYHGISHMFIVTLGRLSYADSPEWISPDLRLDLDQTTEIAKELLDLLVDGPEHEMVWSAFQAEEDMVDGRSPEDDEEQEARKLHPADVE
ncbi:hypothetical protein AcV5_007334 [Taiwanofungus camphoratus]|nr:hypothetical protein AcV5_007334 [Antrodia cinnamomea]